MGRQVRHRRVLRQRAASPAAGAAAALCLRGAVIGAGGALPRGDGSRGAWPADRGATVAAVVEPLSRRRGRGDRRQRRAVGALCRRLRDPVQDRAAGARGARRDRGVAGCRGPAARPRQDARARLRRHVALSRLSLCACDGVRRQEHRDAPGANRAVLAADTRGRADRRADRRPIAASFAGRSRHRPHRPGRRGAARGRPVRPR